MKKVIFVLAIALVSVTGAVAQKQTGGEKNLEVQFTPLGGSPIGINGIRFRMFNSESSAIRIGLSVGGTNTKTVWSQQFKVDGSDADALADVTIPELYDTQKSFNFSIRPGYEKHFAGTDRLSPYMGGEIIFAMGKDTHEKEFHNANNILDVGKAENWQTWTMTTTQGTTTIGVNLLGGVDFYFADNIYMGAEVGFGFQNKKFKDKETEASSADAWKQSGTVSDLFPDGSLPMDDSEFNQAVWNNDGTQLEYRTIIGDDKKNFQQKGWGPTFQSTIRLGWLFN